LIENTHFLFNKITAFELGQKALAVNISDIAAMGGTPQSAYISLGIPEKVDIEWLKEFYEGLSFLSKESKTPILGGDTTRSQNDLVINITIIGKVKNEHLKLRSGAKPGDLICVTSTLGESACGLKLVLRNLPLSTAAERAMYKAHNLPRPFLAEGSFLGKKSAVTSMIDVSDGIDSDIRRIMQQSQVGAIVDLEKIPISGMMEEVCGDYGWEATTIAATGGEDYCLLCTVKPDNYEEISAEYKKKFKSDLYTIGKITDKKTLEYVLKNKPVELNKSGFDHFKSE
jgi:thiamine-monophosphate kinase